MKDNKSSKSQSPAPSSWKAQLSSIPVVIWLAIFFLIFAWIALPIRNGVFLRWMEDCSLFEPVQTARENLMRYPGGLLQYVGSYLMQFMYIPKLGSSILFILWMLLAFMIVKCFRLPKSLSPLSLLIPIFLLASILVLDEAWLTILYKGYLYAPTLGFIIVVGLVWVYRLIKPWWAASCFSILMVFLYPLIGFYALLTALIQTIYSFLLFKKSRALASSAVVLLLIVITPLLYYRFFTGTWVEGNYLWFKGLPDLMWRANDVYLFLPFLLSSALLVILPLMQRVKAFSGRYATVCTVIVVVIAGMWCSKKVDKPEDWRAMALMQLHIDRMNWDKVVMVADNMKGPLTPELAYFANMGREICGMPKYKYNVRNVDPGEVTNVRKRPAFLRTAFMAVPADYFLGEYNLSYRWAMEHSVKYGHRAFLLKYMVRCCIQNGDYELARHYNDMLARTIFHREWSEHYGKFIDNPSLIESDPELSGIKQKPNPDTFYH